MPCSVSPNKMTFFGALKYSLHLDNRYCHYVFQTDVVISPPFNMTAGFHFVASLTVSICLPLLWITSSCNFITVSWYHSCSVFSFSIKSVTDVSIKPFFITLKSPMIERTKLSFTAFTKCISLSSSNVQQRPDYCLIILC